MLPIDPKRIAEELRTLPERGRAAAEARFMRWSEENPTKRCEHCFGRGSYAQAPCGTTRPFDHTDFRVGVDRFVETCPRCRGLGRVFISREEAKRIEQEAIEHERRRYALIRRATCKAWRKPSAWFDRLARKRVGANATPADWANAAAAVAAELGT